MSNSGRFCWGPVKCPSSNFVKFQGPSSPTCQITGRTPSASHDESSSADKSNVHFARPPPLDRRRLLWPQPLRPPEQPAQRDVEQSLWVRGELSQRVAARTRARLAQLRHRRHRPDDLRVAAPPAWPAEPRPPPAALEDAVDDGGGRAARRELGGMSPVGTAPAANTQAALSQSKLRAASGRPTGSRAFIGRSKEGVGWSRGRSQAQQAKPTAMT